jgi:hypothetical protein
VRAHQLQAARRREAGLRISRESTTGCLSYISVLVARRVHGPGVGVVSKQGGRGMIDLSHLQARHIRARATMLGLREQLVCAPDASRAWVFASTISF